MAEKVNLGSVEPGTLFKFKGEYYLRIVTHTYACNCIQLGEFDVCELAPGLLVASSQCWKLTPKLFATLCYSGDAQEIADVWQRHLKEAAKEIKNSEG